MSAVRKLALLGVCYLGVACATSPPISVGTDDIVERPSDKKNSDEKMINENETSQEGRNSARAADCSVKPGQPVNETCDMGDKACVGRNRARWEVLHKWGLKCERTNPVDPIEGEHVSVFVGVRLDNGPGVCSKETPTIEREKKQNDTLIKIDMNYDGDCTKQPSVAWVSLGVLKEGRYVVDNGFDRTDFVVRNKNADPGPLNVSMRIALEVARLYKPSHGEYEGRRGWASWHVPRIYFGVGGGTYAQSRLARQMAKAFPNKNAQELEKRAHSTAGIIVRPGDAPDEWIYTFTDGHRCAATDLRGTARLEADGTLKIEKPQVVKHHIMPC